MIELPAFLDNFKELEDYAKKAKYEDEVNPVDGVVYPCICKDIPERVMNDLIYCLTFKILQRRPKDPFVFLRRSPEGVPVPHKFHTDHSMGDFSMMIYLQDNPDAGTGLAIHKEMGISRAPDNQEQLNKAIEDCNDDSKWQIYKIAEMMKNKAVIFDSQLFHVALPIGGFGEGKESRTVLTCFFS